MQIEDNELAELTATASGMLAEYSKTDEDRFERACAIGKVMSNIKKVLELKKGAFNAYIQAHFNIEKSWRSAIIKLHEDRVKMPLVRKWGMKHGLRNTTVSDVSKLLYEYDLRDEHTDEPRQQAFKSALELTEVQKREVSTLHATWADELMSAQEADGAELALYRMASAQGMLLKKLLKKADLEPPHKLAIAAEKKLPPKQVSEALESSVASTAPSISPESTLSNTLVESDVEPPLGNLGTVYGTQESQGVLLAAEVLQKEVGPVSSTRKSSRSQTAVSWGLRFSAEVKAKAYDRMRLSHAQGLPYGVISQHLRCDMGMSVGPTKIARLLAEDASTWAPDFQECVRQIDLKRAA